MSRYIIPAVCGIFLMAGCSDQPEEPDELINENTYVNMLVELQLLRTYAEAVQLDSSATDSLAQEVYNKFGTSDEQFRESHHYYQQFPQAQKERIDRAIELLRMDQVKDTTEVQPSAEPSQ